MKKHTTVTLEIDLLELAREKGLNISELCNDALRAKVGVKQQNVETEKLLLQELELAQKFSLSENELFLLKDNFDKDVASFWRVNKANFPNVKTIFDLIEIRKAFEPLWAKETKEIQEVKNK